MSMIINDVHTKVHDRLKCWTIY